MSATPDGQQPKQGGSVRRVQRQPDQQRQPDRHRRGPGRPTLSNEELLDTALDLFLDNGFERTSIEAICASAGMAKRTVYARYGDKEALFRATLERATNRWVVPLDRLHAAETDDLEQTLLAVGRVLLANVMSPLGVRLMRLTNAEAERMPDVSVANVRRGTEPTLTWLADLFTRRLTSDGVDPADADAAARAYINLVVRGPANLAAWGGEPDPRDVERDLVYSVRLFLHGVLPRNGGNGGNDAGAAVQDALAKIDEARAVLDGIVRQSTARQGR